MFFGIKEINNCKFINAINSAYELQNPEGISEEKKAIKLFFKSTEELDNKELLRLTVINAVYSTQMEKNKNSLVELSKLIKAKRECLNLKKLFMCYFENGQKEKNIKELFNEKYGDRKRYAWSIISKYAYFLTDFEFPIYDSLVRDALHVARREKYIKTEDNKKILKSDFEFSNSQPNSSGNIHDYFQYIYELRESLHKDLCEMELDKNTVDKLDAFGWATGKLIEERRQAKKDDRLERNPFYGWKDDELEVFKEKLRRLKLLDSPFIPSAT